MAPIHQLLQNTRRAAIAAAPQIAKMSTEHLLRRSLTVNSTQKVTLGIIAVYVVVIALLWNIPYVRWSLWPFKVCSSLLPRKNALIFADAYNRLP